MSHRRFFNFCNCRNRLRGPDAPCFPMLRHTRGIPVLAALAAIAAVWSSSPARHSIYEEFEKTKKEMEQSGAKQKELAEESEKLEAELNTLQQKLVRLA